jgi:thymidylate kinase
MAQHPSESYLFILFEGLNRTGKTKIAEEVARRVGGLYLHSPPEELMPYRKLMDRYTQPEINLAFYLHSNHRLDNRVKNELEATHVVLDRYYPSTIAYHSLKLDRNIDHLMKNMITVPDRIYFLTATQEKVDERYEKSTRSKKNPRFHGLDGAADKEFRRIFKDMHNVMMVDTTHMSLEETFDVVWDDFKKHFADRIELKE